MPFGQSRNDDGFGEPAGRRGSGATNARRVVSVASSDPPATVIATGGNLPSVYAPWQPATEGGAVLVGGGVGPVTEAIRQDGFFIAIEEEAVRSASKAH